MKTQKKKRKKHNKETKSLMNTSRRSFASTSNSGYSPHVALQDTSLLIDLHPEPIPLRLKNRPITNEDIHELKIERQKLLDERTQLKTKIARLEVQAKKSAKSSNINPQLLNQLDRDYKTVEHLIMQQRARINELKNSDSAAQREELQEEAKIIFMEKRRLTDQLKQEEISLNDMRKERDMLIQNDGPEVFSKQQDRIEQLETKLKKYNRENERLAARVKTLKARKQLEEEAQNGNQGQMANQIRAQIKDIEEKTEEIDEKIRRTVEQHEEILEKLKNSTLDENGAQQPNNDFSNQENQNIDKDETTNEEEIDSNAKAADLLNLDDLPDIDKIGVHNDEEDGDDDNVDINMDEIRDSINVQIEDNEGELHLGDAGNDDENV